MNTNIEKLKRFSIENGEVTDVSWTAGMPNPEPNPLGIHFVENGSFYKVTLKMHPTSKSDITVAVYLPEPENWNGKFLGTGNGGFAGTIAEGGLLNGVGRGYATANTDMGMPKDPDECMDIPEIWEDFGYRSTHVMTVVGKALTTYFYGKAPAYAYYIGGSTGGQQGFSEASRYPNDYDGIICLSPAMDRIRLHSFFIWNWQQIHSRADATFTPEVAQAWRACIERVYKKECGSNADDHFLIYPGRIQGNPMDHPDLQGDIKRLLTDGQREALREIYEGPKDPITGERVIAAFLPGTESEGLSLADTSNKENFEHDFFYPFRWVLGKDFDFFKFDFHKDLQAAIEKLSPVLDSADTDLGAYKAAGGKLLVIGGSSDAIIPYTGFLDYYHKVIANHGGIENTNEFFRFILMPGFSHTIGGNGVQEIGSIGSTIVPRDADHDVICAMEQWVERGIAPMHLLGTHMKFTESGLQFDYARPGYAYPYVTVFDGGNPENPDNYHAVEDAQKYV